MEEIVAEERVAGMPARAIGAVKVAVLLLLVAIVFSYLGAFAVTNALVSADLLERWPAGQDPRPRWMLTAFGSMSGTFVVVAGWVKFTVWRQMRRLDRMEETDG